MKTKTWKLGEVAQGGVITVEITGKVVAIIGKEWDISAGTRRSSNQSNAKEFTRETIVSDDWNSYWKMRNFLEDLTTSYHAGKIMYWIEEKIGKIESSKNRFKQSDALLKGEKFERPDFINELLKDAKPITQEEFELNNRVFEKSEVKTKLKKSKAVFFKSRDYVGRSFARKEDIGVGRGGVGLTSRIGICSKKSN